MADLESYAVFTDIHFPYEDRQRYELALRILDTIPSLAGIFLNGDIGEFQSVSRWPVHPKENMGFCAELDYLNKRLDELQTRFDLPTVYASGNHEDRFFRFVRDVAPQIFGLLDCPTLLKFPDRPKWRFVPYGPTQIYRCGKSNLWLRHEPIGGGANPAKPTAEKSVVDIAFGHTHVYQEYTHRKFGPTPYLVRAYSLGWLGDKSRPCFDYRGSKDNWNLGFTIVECDPSSGEYQLDFISLERLPVFYRGRRFDLKEKRAR